MSQLVESLKRLYKSGQVTADYVTARTSLTDGVMKLCISKVDNNAYSPADYPQNWTIE